MNIYVYINKSVFLKCFFFYLFCFKFRTYTDPCLAPNDPATFLQ